MVPGQWEHAWRVAKSKLGEEEAVKILEAPALRLEKAGQLREAEKLVLAMGQHEKAVDMYRRQRRYDEVSFIHNTYLLVIFIEFVPSFYFIYLFFYLYSYSYI